MEWHSDDILVVKTNKYSSAKKYGVNEGEEIKPLVDRINSDKIVSLNYIIVNAFENIMYYEGSWKEAEKIIKQFFAIKNVIPIPDIDLNDFAKLSKITITQRPTFQQSLLGETYSNDTLAAEVEELSEGSRIEKDIRTFEIMAKNGILTKKLAAFIKKFTYGNSFVSLVGEDKNGRKIQFSADRLSRIVTVETKVNDSYEERKAYEVSNIIKELNAALTLESVKRIK